LLAHLEEKEEGAIQKIELRGGCGDRKGKSSWSPVDEATSIWRRQFRDASVVSQTKLQFTLSNPGNWRNTK
jgi:hypothetical protein